MSLIEKNWKLILGSIGFVVLVGAGFAINEMINSAKEKTTQENFFIIEKKYADYKTKKEKKDDTGNKAVVEKAGIENLKNKLEAKPSVESLAAELTGIKSEFSIFIDKNIKSKASQMAALYYAEILRDENNKELALSTLKKVQSNDSGLVNTLVQQQIGQLLADSNQFQEAIDIWQKIINRKDANFLHDTLKIQQALCYQKLNNFKKAEEILTNVANQKVENTNEPATSTTSAKEAARYLRWIQLKKTSGT